MYGFGPTMILEKVKERQLLPAPNTTLLKLHSNTISKFLKIPFYIGNKNPELKIYILKK